MDNYNLRQVILDYPSQLELGQKFANKTALNFDKKNYDNIVVCGMGGSALPGDMLDSYFESVHNLKMPIIVARGYSLPSIDTTKNSLIFISSYSGNTEETISCFQEALESGNDIVAFSAGGKIEKIAKENNVPHVKYNIKFDHFEPRYATTYAFMAMHQVLTNLELVDIMENLPKINSREYEVYGEELAGKAKDMIPVIYASNKYKSLARNWKIKINENSKHPAFWNYFPELNHNELLGFTNPQNNYIVFMLMDDEEDRPENIKRMHATIEIYNNLGIATEVVKIKGKDYLEKVLNTLIIGDWLSYYLALEYGQDPTPVDLVEKFKKKIS